LVLTYLSKDMEEGYPGNLQTKVTYTLNNDNTLEVVYEATTDKKTIVNLTQHSYFNLSGDFSKTILDHEITINADKLVPVDATLIPTGELTDVSNTPFDFRQAKAIGKDIEAKDEQLKRGQGYDHCWVLNNQNEGMRFAASAYHPESGRLMEVSTDEPGIQLYTGNFLDGTLPSKQSGTYGHRTGFCLETQHYPDSPNQKDFPSVVLNPGENYKTTTTFKFSVK
jgi:aldose 1-epimerase